MVDWSVTFIGLTLGPGTSFGVTGISGWLDKPAVRSNDAPRAASHGAFDTVTYSDARIVTIEFDIASDAQPFAQAVADLLAATSLTAGLADLSIQIPGRGVESTKARIRQRSVPTEMEYAFGLTSAALQLYCPDPLCYGPQVTSSTSLQATTPGTGLLYPLAYPLDYGVPAGVTPGSIQVANAGTEAYWPHVQVYGPVTNPVVTLNETGDTIRYNGTVADGQMLDIDCANRRVLLGSATAMESAASRRFAVSASGNWLAVPVGGGTLSVAADSAGTSASMSVSSYEGARS